MLLRLFINFLVLSQSIECIVKGEFLPCLFLRKEFLLLVQYKCVFQEDASFDPAGCTQSPLSRCSVHTRWSARRSALIVVLGSI